MRVLRLSIQPLLWVIGLRSLSRSMPLPLGILKVEFRSGLPTLGAQMPSSNKGLLCKQSLRTLTRPRAKKSATLITIKAQQTYSLAENRIRHRGMKIASFSQFGNNVELQL